MPVDSVSAHKVWIRRRGEDRDLSQEDCEVLAKVFGFQSPSEFREFAITQQAKANAHSTGGKR